MNFFQTITFKFFAVTAFIFLSSSVFAGTNGSVTFAPVDPSAIPTLSSTMLIVLSLLLMVVAFRVSKQKSSGNFFAIILGASVLIASTGGIKLVSDLEASGEISISMPEGGSVDLFSDFFHQIRNSSGVLQRITAINEPSSCENFPDGIDIGGPECSVGTTLESGVNASFCIIDCRSRPEIIDSIQVE